MKSYGLIIATLVFVALAGTLYWSEHHKPSEATAKASSDSAPPILKVDEGSITKLELKKKAAAPIVLIKASSGQWQITAPQPVRADDSTVASMLSTLSSLNSERVVEDKAADLKRYGLDEPAVEVDLIEKDNKSQSLLIGDDTPTGGAVYAALKSDPRVFTIASYNKNSVDKTLNDLRDKRLLTVNSDKISRVELAQRSEDIEFGRNKDDWQILKPRPLRADSSQVGDLVRKLTDARMDLSGTDTDGKKAASSFAHGTGVATAKLTDESGTQELLIHKEKDKYYAKSTAVDGVFPIDSSLGQAVEKKLDNFRNKKLFDFGFNDPQKIELHNGSKAYYLSRGSNSEDWWSNGKKMDAGSVQSLISKLRDLEASKFVASGFAKSTIEAVITSDDGKRVEKVSIAKSDTGYIAKRENDATLYQLNANSVDELQKAAEEIKPASGTSR
jgi:uncharacterized protein DUF4340